MQDLSMVLGENSSFTDLSKEEKNILKNILEMEISRREKSVQFKQVREIMPIRSWLESEYHLGPNAVRIYDYWKETLAEIFDEKRDDSNRINEVILGGSIGVGKSTIGEIILIRKFYELSCFENICSMLGLMSTSSIVFLYFSINKYQANLTGFGDVRAMLDSIPYFRDEFPRNSKIDSLLLLPENIMMTYGSGSQHAIGMNMMGCILDEANFFRGESRDGAMGANATSKIGELYSSIINRQKSRFVTEGGMDHSLCVLISSSTSTSSFTEQRIRQSKGDPHTIVRTPTLWEVKPNNYSKKMFYVFKGSNMMEPYIINSLDDINQFRLAEGMKRIDQEEATAESPEAKVEEADVIESEIKKLPPHYQDLFLAVPENFKPGFDSNIITALQDIGGVSTAPTGKLFTSVEVYNKSIVGWINHPFISESITISTGDRIRVAEYLKKGVIFRDLHKPRYAHLDQSATSDCTGISVVYIDKIIEEDGVKKPIIAVDFMIRIVPPKPPKRLAIYKLRDFMVWLAQNKGIRWGKITYDFWNSEESRQILTEMGYDAGYQSVDKTDKAYVDFVTLMYEERVKTYDYAPFKREIFSVIHDRDRKKVDHPKTLEDGTVGSKDVSDSLVGAIFNAVSSTFTENQSHDSIGDFRRANPMYTSEFAGANMNGGLTMEQLIDLEIDRMLNEFD